MDIWVVIGLVIAAVVLTAAVTGTSITRTLVAHFDAKLTAMDTRYRAEIGELKKENTDLKAELASQKKESEFLRKLIYDLRGDPKAGAVTD